MIKSRTFRKAGAVVLSLAMALSLSVSTSASAAAKPGLKSTKATVKVGKTKKIAVKNVKLVKKITVTSKNKKIAKAAKVGKKAVKITGVKTGSTKVVVKLYYTKKKFVKKTIKVTVAKATTDDDGTTVTQSLKLVDKDGLQTDGTAAIGDEIQVQIPGTIGTIDRVNWYLNDALVEASGAQATSTSCHPGKAGILVARVITTKGTTYESDKLTVSDKETRATVSAFTIEDDYDDKFVALAKDDDKAIVTATLSKDYYGEIQVFAAKDGKPDGKAVGKIKTGDYQEVKNSNGTVIGYERIGYESSTLYTNHALFAKDKKTDGTALNHLANVVKADDGSTTYKFFLDGKVTRGKDYILVFDQDKVIDDDASSATPNVSTTFTAPYVTQPTGLTIEPVTNGLKVKADFVGADGKPLGWIGVTANANGIPAETNNGVTVTKAGFDSVTFYNDKNNSVSSKSTKFAAADNVKGGVFASANDADRAISWFIAEAKTTKGIFGKDQATITSTAVTINPDVATKVSVEQLGTDTTDKAKTAKITLDNLAGDATVYFVKTKYGDDGKVAKDGDIVSRYKAFDASKDTTYDKSVEVTKGTQTVNIENAFEKSGDQARVIVVPKDAAYYGRKDSDLATVKASFTKYALKWADCEAFIATGSNTGKIATGSTEETIVFGAKDQFGNDMKWADVDASKSTLSIVGEKTDKTQVGLYADGVAPSIKVVNGAITLYSDSVTPTLWSGAGSFIGETWTFKLSDAQTVKIVMTKAKDSGTTNQKKDRFVITLV